MVALAPEVTPAREGFVSNGRRVVGRLRPFRWVVLTLAGLYFFVPMFAALRFALQNDAGHFSLAPVTQIPAQPGLAAAFWLSVRLAAVTLVISLGLMVPTVIYVHLRAPRLRRLFETITLLPIVIPPIVLILGILEASPSALKASPYLLSLVYVVLVMPFIYRSLDTGLVAIDLAVLVDAARSLGAGWVRTVWRVVMPNMRSALLSATVLSVALVLGEFTMASLDLWETLPVWIVDFAQTDGHVTTAVAMLSLIGTWVLLAIIVSLDHARSRRRLAKEDV